MPQREPRDPGPNQDHDGRQADQRRAYPDAIAITPDGRTAYVANGGIRTVTPIRTRTNTPGSPIKVGLGPQALAITPDGKTVYAVTPYETTPISTAAGKPGKPIKTAGGHAIAITPAGETAYVVRTPVHESNPGAVIPIHVATNTAGKPGRRQHLQFN